jgi:ferredoxin
MKNMDNFIKTSLNSARSSLIRHRLQAVCDRFETACIKVKVTCDADGAQCVTLIPTYFDVETIGYVFNAPFDMQSIKAAIHALCQNKCPFGFRYYAYKCEKYNAVALYNKDGDLLEYWGYDTALRYYCEYKELSPSEAGLFIKTINIVKEAKAL